MDITGKKGYVRIHRELRDKGYYKDSHYVHLWVHLVMKANHAGNEFLWNEENIMIQRGQLLTGELILSRETGIERSKVRRILKCFENEQQIERHTTNKFSIITILNYDKYQYSEQQTEQPVNNKRTTSEQPVNTNNTYNTSKAYKENKKTYIDLGEYDYVKLTKEEKNKLDDLIGENNVEVLISELNDYIGATGKKYKSHYHVVRSWAKRKAQEHAKLSGKKREVL